MPKKKQKRSTDDTVEEIKAQALEDLADGALTPKMESFILNYFETGNASEAYRRAYNAENMKAETIHVRACELLKHGKIKARVDGLRKIAAQRAAVSAQSILDELEQARLMAMQLEMPGVMVTASMGRAKVAGIIVDKKETGPAGAFDNMSKEELEKYVVEEAKALGLTSPKTNGTTRH